MHHIFTSQLHSAVFRSLGQFFFISYRAHLPFSSRSTYEACCKASLPFAKASSAFVTSSADASAPPSLFPTHHISSPSLTLPTQFTYKRLFQLLERRRNLGLHTRQNVPRLRQCLFLPLRSASNFTRKANSDSGRLDHTSCFKVYSLFSSPSLSSSFLMRSSCCTISLW
jgi:hypothetical protein